MTRQKQKNIELLKIEYDYEKTLMLNLLLILLNITFFFNKSKNLIESFTLIIFYIILYILIINSFLRLKITIKKIKKKLK